MFEYGLMILIYASIAFCIYYIFFVPKFVLVLIMLKLFDILGPPKIINFKKQILESTHYNFIKTQPNAIYLLFPHGATLFPALRLPVLYNLGKEFPIIFINKWFLLIPGFVGLVKLFGGYITSETGNLKLAIMQNARPIIIYPNGAKEVLNNSYKNSKNKILDIKDKLLKHLLKSKRFIHVVTIQNESECYYFNRLLICIWRFINNFLDIGIPFPLPYATGKKIKMHMSDSINTRKFKSIQDLKQAIYDKVVEAK